MARLDIDRNTTALLLMDYQVAVVNTFVPSAAEVLPQATSVLGAARAASILGIHVKVEFRPGYPEVHPRNVTFSQVKAAGLLLKGDPGTEIVSELAPAADEPVVVKHRVSPVPGTDLETILRSQGIETIALAGIATSGVVLSAVRALGDADYRLLVLGDLCADGNPQLHTTLLRDVFPMHAQVVRSQAFVQALGEGGGD